MHPLSSRKCNLSQISPEGKPGYTWGSQSITRSRYDQKEGNLTCARTVERSRYLGAILSTVKMSVNLSMGGCSCLSLCASLESLSAGNAVIQKEWVELYQRTLAQFAVFRLCCVGSTLFMEHIPFFVVQLLFLWTKSLSKAEIGWAFLPSTTILLWPSTLGSPVHKLEKIQHHDLQHRLLVWCVRHPACRSR